MDLLFLLSIGMGASVIMRRFMPNRSFSAGDDLLWGMLGALLGDSLADISGLFSYGVLGTLVMPSAGVVFLLFLTGMIKVEFEPEERPALVSKRKVVASPSVAGSEAIKEVSNVPEAA